MAREEKLEAIYKEMTNKETEIEKLEQIAIRSWL